MQHFMMDGYTRSRLQETERSLARAADRWTPPARGPGLLDRVGLALVAVGSSMVRDRALLDRVTADAHARAA